MATKKNYFLLAIVVIGGVPMIGCGKETVDKKSENTLTENVFVSGYVDMVYNGVRMLQAIYWKNDSLVLLPFPDGFPVDGNPGSVTWGIYADGADVYVAGSTGGKAVFWKNGLPTVLTPLQH